MSQNNLSVIVQTRTSQFSNSGIESDGKYAIGINLELGLLALAQADDEIEQGSAYKAIEIMLDDMSLNLPGISGSRQQSIDAGRCLKESVDNINEYLVSKSANAALPDEQGTELAVIQIQKNFLSCCQTANFSSLQFTANQILDLGNDKPSHGSLGLQPVFDSKVNGHTLAPGDILLVTSVNVIKLIGENFLRVTVSRFSDNLQMLLRQINTRASHNGLKNKPVIALCRFDGPVEEQRSWLDKFRKH